MPRSSHPIVSQCRRIGIAPWVEGGREIWLDAQSSQDLFPPRGRNGDATVPRQWSRATGESIALSIQPARTVDHIILVMIDD